MLGWLFGTNSVSVCSEGFGEMKGAVDFSVGVCLPTNSFIFSS